MIVIEQMTRVIRAKMRVNEQIVIRTNNWSEMIVIWGKLLYQKVNRVNDESEVITLESESECTKSDWSK